MSWSTDDALAALIGRCEATLATLSALNTGLAIMESTATPTRGDADDQ